MRRDGGEGEGKEDFWIALLMKLGACQLKAALLLAET